MKKAPADDQLLALVLFGSHATGKATPDSDVDVCLISKSRLPLSDRKIRQLAPDLPPGKLSVACFTPKVLKAMCDYGSLFLWHVRLEGKPIVGEKHLGKIWKKLKPFTAHSEEVDYHSLLYKNIAASTRRGRQVNECDLSVLFTIARNVCMILAHKAGRQVFGRNESFQTAIQLYPDLPLRGHHYKALSRWKMIYENRVAPEERLPNLKRNRTFMKQVKKLLSYAKEAIG